MSFKADTSFLRFLTMGAVGAQAALEYFAREGFSPIELERYSTSNKIWATKVKRLRVPDLLCVRSGIRIEVRAKSELKIRMSDAPNNPERRWDVGLRDEDLVALVVCGDDAGRVRPAGDPVTVNVGDLRSTVNEATLGAPKSASEGSERDRTWPAWVPKKDGKVVGVGDQRIRVQYPDRAYTYPLKGKTAYVSEGDSFEGRTSILAGVLPRLADLERARQATWDPYVEIESPDPIDRYVATRAIPHLGNAMRGLEILDALIDTESDARVALEMACSAARLGSEHGHEHIRRVIWQGDASELKMEGLLILGELHDKEATIALREVAGADEFAGEELRQAAVWGLGKAGARDYATLLEFIADDEAEVALHAIVGFGRDAPQPAINELVRTLRIGNPREKPAASAALIAIGSNDVMASVIQAIRASEAKEPWLIATLGQLDPNAVRKALDGEPILSDLEPLLVLSDENNWLANSTVASDLAFLSAQRL